ncbi:MAG: dolichol-phosphate mannosyltransferase [Vicingaceae bacterium]
MENKSTLTILVPIYNEEENIHQFAEEMNKYLELTPVESKVLFVNDGSSDNSQSLIEQVCTEHKGYSYIELLKNKGLSTAVKAGIDYCKSDLVGYIDADIQTKPQEFLKYFEFFPEYDLVNGIRANRKDTVVKKMSSKIANAFRRKMINDGIEDTGCPLKIMKTEYAKRIPFFDGMHRFIPALIQLQGGKVKQIPVTHYPRFAGTAKYHLWNRIKKPFFDTFAFRWMRSRYIRYEIKNEG